MGVALSISWEGRSAKDFSRVFATAASIQNFRPVLGVIAKDIIAPSIDANFKAQGRPKWQPLAESTVRRKAAAGYREPTRILFASGAMKGAASSVSEYVLSKDTLVAAPFSTKYWTFHQRGDGLPQRVIMMLQAMDRTKINSAFANYLRSFLVFDPHKAGARQFTGGRRF